MDGGMGRVCGRREGVDQPERMAASLAQFVAQLLALERRKQPLKANRMIANPPPFLLTQILLLLLSALLPPLLCCAVAARVLAAPR